MAPPSLTAQVALHLPQEEALLAHTEHQAMKKPHGQGSDFL
jgi:hypothetical protein